MRESRWLYFALGVTTVISLGAVTNQLVPLAPASGLSFDDTGITFPDGTVQTTATGNPDPPCFNSTHRFVDCNNGTVTDTVTGLIYLKGGADCLPLSTYSVANRSAAGLGDGSCDLTDNSRPGDWRLPTKDEWLGILAPACPSGPKIVGNGLDSSTSCFSDSGWADDVTSSTFWSSTTKFGAANQAWVVNLSSGDWVPGGNTKEMMPNVLAWPVRGPH